MSDHKWVSKSGRPWSLRVKSDLCAVCGTTPDCHPSDYFYDLRALSAAATPGEWVAQSSDDGSTVPWWIDTHAYEDGPEPVWAPPQYPVSREDVALIVAAVNYLRRLFAADTRP